MSDENYETSVPRISKLSLAEICGESEKEMLQGLQGDFKFKAPEVLLGLAYGKKADVWSLGVILFYILAEELPFTEKNYGPYVR